jgi:alcohol dehydrogenase (NADP+)
MPSLAFANGDAMPALGLGTWCLPLEQTATTVRTALALGYRHIDTAASYGNGAQIGSALRRALAEGAVRREELWITSKLWNDAHEPQEVRPALERSLRDLGLDQLDLYLMHWPVAQRRGVGMPTAPSDQYGLDQVPLAATWAAMEELVEAGLCRQIGVSNFSLAKLIALGHSAQIQPAVLQVERHPLLQQNDLLAHCQGAGIHLTAYAPLGAPGDNRSPLVLHQPEVEAIAAERQLTPAQVLLAWGIGCGTAVIPKTVQPQRLAENLAAAWHHLDDDLMARLAGLDQHQRLVKGDFWCLEGGPYTLENLWEGSSKGRVESAMAPGLASWRSRVGHGGLARQGLSRQW